MYIIICDSDSFFRSGMVFLFRRRFGNAITISFSLSMDNIRLADIIVLPVHAGDLYFCQPVFNYRKQSLIVGMTPEPSWHSKGGLPLCMKNIVLVHRKERTETVIRLISHAWEGISFPPEACGGGNQDCSICPILTLTEAQIRMAEYFCAGRKTTEIAGLLNISVRTAFSRKYSLMLKLGLSTNEEFLTLIRRLLAGRLLPGRGRD